MRIIFILGSPGSDELLYAGKLFNFLVERESSVAFIVSSESRDIENDLKKFPAWVSASLAEKIKIGKFAPFIFDCFNAIKKIKNFPIPPDFIIWSGAPKSYNELVILKDFVSLYKVKAEVICLTIPENLSRERLKPDEVNKQIFYFKKTTLTGLEAIQDKQKSFNEHFDVHYINAENIEPSVFNNLLRKLNL